MKSRSNVPMPHRRTHSLRFPLLTFFATLVLSLPASAANILVNGGFEKGDLTGWTTALTVDGQNFGDFGVEIFDVVEGVDSYAAKFNVGTTSSNLPRPLAGAVIQQEATISIPGGDYRLSADVAIQKGLVPNLARARFELLFDDIVVDSYDIDPLDGGTNRETLFALLSDVTAGTHEVAIKILRDAGADSQTPIEWVDNVSLSLVPIPATLPLMASGLALLGLFRVWRKRRVG